MSRKAGVIALFLITGIAYFAFRGGDEPKATPTETAKKSAENDSEVPPLSIPRARPGTPRRPQAAPKQGTLEARAHELLRDGKLAEAMAVMREILEQDPRNEFALMELAILLSQDPRNRKEAEGLFRKALEVNPENFVALDEILTLYLDPNNPDRAHKMIADYHRSHPDSPNFNAAYGRSLAAQGDLDAAILHLQRATRGDEGLVEGVYFSLAELYRQKGDTAAAVDAYSKVVSSQEQSLQNLRKDGIPTDALERDIMLNQLNLANALISNRQFDEAERLTRSIVERDPGNQAAVALLKRLQSGG